MTVKVQVPEPVPQTGSGVCDQSLPSITLGGAGAAPQTPRKILFLKPAQSLFCAKPVQSIGSTANFFLLSSILFSKHIVNQGKK